MSIPALKHHIVFVSDQALPTVLAASLPRAAPSHIHAVVSQTMRDKALVLQNALHARGCMTVTRYELDDNFSQEALYRVLDAIRASVGTESLGVNLTGGTKLMALAAAEWASVFDVPAFYIDTANEQFIQIAETWQYTPLPDVLGVRDLLSANGFDIESADTSPVPAQRRDVLQRLLKFACTPEGATALGRLNYLAQKAAKTDLLVDDGSMNPAWEEMLHLCSEAGTLQETASGLRFPSEEARRWCNGIWFEEYVKMTLFHLHARKKIKDWASSVRVRRNGVLNELDALFSVRNRLFILECKTTAMLGTKEGTADRVASVLYKADALHDRLGGLFAKAMLCSVRPLAGKDKERARQQLGVHTICGEDLLRLEENLILWSYTS